MKSYEDMDVYQIVHISQVNQKNNNFKNKVLKEIVFMQKLLKNHLA